MSASNPPSQTAKDVARRERFDNLLEWAGDKLDLRKDHTLLEFGVGQNGFSDFYAEYVKHVIGLDIVDFSSFHVGRNFQFMQYDGIDIPVESGTFDVVVSHSVLEHVDNIRQSMAEIDRVLKVGGQAFLTVSPLYYSSWGSHVVKDGRRQDDWSHLDYDSEVFLVTNPLKDSPHGGHSLNKMVMADVLFAVGEQPWNVVSCERRYEAKKINESVLKFASSSTSVSKLDLITKEFRLIIRKTRSKPVW